MTSIDLNADLGEGFGRWRLTDDEPLLSVVTSANVACGFHAGDAATMRRVCELAAERGVRIGAQVSYRDLAGFGRRAMDVPPDELAAEVAYQIGALEVFARAAGARVAYVKPHGALYNRVVHDEEQAAAVVDGRAPRRTPALPVLGLPGSRLLDAGREGRTARSSPRRSPTAPTPTEGTLVPRGEDGRGDHRPRRRRGAVARPRPRPARSPPAPGGDVAVARPLPVPARRHPGRAWTWPAGSGPSWTASGVRVEAFA